MAHPKETKLLARELREQGASLPYIMAQLNLPKITVYGWICDIPYTPSECLRVRVVRPRKERVIRLKVPKERKERLISGDGYWMVPAPQGYAGKTYIHGYVYEHRLIIEQKLGRYLIPGEVVHHINHDRLDNSEDNLGLMGHRDHSAMHTGERMRHVEYVTVQCEYCGRCFERLARMVRRGAKIGSRIFCNQSCQIKYQHMHGMLAGAGRKPKV